MRQKVVRVLRAVHVENCLRRIKRHTQRIGMAIYIGTSGWSYDHWQGVLYPEQTAPRDRLACYTARFSTVEINATFYRWPAQSAIASWQKRLPRGFLMSVKAPRILTHQKRLFQPEAWLERVTNDLWQLGDKLGVVLLQLSPYFECDY